MRGAGARVQARVVGHRLDAVAGEELGGLLDRVAREAVHDARVARVLLAQERQQLLLGVGFRDDPVLDVGPVEARLEVARMRHGQALGDLLVRRVCGRGRQRDARDVRPALAEQRESQVVGAEVVTPLGHAVRLVDREDGDLRPRQQVQRAVQAQPLRGQVEQVQLARQQLGLDHAALVEVLRGVHEAGAHAQRAQRVHLVLHQGDERRDDHACTRSDQGRNLIAERLAATRRHQDDGVTARHHVLDDRFLLAAEGVVPEDPVERGQCLALPQLLRRVRFGHHTRPAHRPVPRASRLDHCVHDRGPRRQPRSYPQAATVRLLCAPLSRPRSLHRAAHLTRVPPVGPSRMATPHDRGTCCSGRRRGRSRRTGTVPYTALAPLGVIACPSVRSGPLSPS